MADNASDLLVPLLLNRLVEDEAHITSYLSLRLLVDKRIYQHLSNFPPKSTKGNFRIADDKRIALVKLPKLGPDANKCDVEYLPVT